MEGRTTDNLAAAGEVSSKVKVRHVLQKEAPLSNKLKLPDLEKLTQVHKAIKLLFKHMSVPSLRLAGRLKSFLPAWQILTQDRQILLIVEGFEKPVSSEPMQEKLPIPMKTTLEQTELIDKEVLEMLQKGAISKVQSVQGQFLSNIFLVTKKDGGFRPVINLKALNKFVPYEHFKMEGLHFLRDILQQGDYMCKIDLKDAYFGIPLAQKSQKYVRFSWKNNLYEFKCLCFGLGPAPRIFTKLLKIPIAVLRRLNIRVVIIFLNTCRHFS